MYAFLITFREGLEAALIVGIVLAYLARTGNRRYVGHVWAGAVAAVVATVAAGGLLALTARQLSGVALTVFEGAAMLLAAAVLTYVIVWMKRQAWRIRERLQGEVDHALRSGSRLALASLSFMVIIREGIETVLFLQAGAATAADPALYWGAAGAGLAAAALLGVVTYSGSARLPLRTFFNVTGVLLIFFAAGMIANGFRELQEVRIVPPVVEHIWDTYWLVPDTSLLGRFMSALLGYDSSPSLLQALSFFGYLIIGLLLFLRSSVPPGLSKPRA